MNPTRTAPTEEMVLPELRFVMTAHVKLAPIRKVGDTPLGVRRMISIIGGAFEGPRLRGRIIPGGADWAIKRTDRVTVIEADYALETDDGAIIRVQNGGLGVPPELHEGRTYIRTIPRLEAPDGPYSWINQAIFVGTLNAPGGADDEVVIRFFEVV